MIAKTNIAFSVEVKKSRTQWGNLGLFQQLILLANRISFEPFYLFLLSFPVQNVASGENTIRGIKKDFPLFFSTTHKSS